MNIISVIAKQEIIKVFKNRKMLSSIFVLPLIMLVAMFAISSMEMDENTESKYQIHFLNMQIAEQEFESGDMMLKVVTSPAVSYEHFVENENITENDMVVELTGEGFKIYYNSLNNKAGNVVPLIKSNILKPYAQSMFLAEQGVMKEDFKVVM